MNLYDSKKCLRRLLSYPYLNTGNRRQCEELLANLKRFDDSEYLTFYGNYLLLINKHEEAKEALEKAVELGYTGYHTYYGLYRIALKEKDYASMYKNALLCDSMKNNTQVDFSLQIALAKFGMQLENNPSVAFSTPIIIPDVKANFSNFTANVFYEEALEALRVGDILGVRDSINKMVSNVDMHDVPFDFSLLLDSTKSLFNLEKMKYLELFRSSSYSCQGFSSLNPRVLLNIISFTVSKDSETAALLLEKNEDFLKEKVKPECIQFLSKKIGERRKYRVLDKEQIKIYKDSLTDIKKDFSTYSYDDVISKCNLSNETFELPIFDYYKAKAYYFSGLYEEAALAFEEYLSSGVGKAKKAYRYLEDIYNVLGMPDKANAIREENDNIFNCFVSENALSNRKRSNYIASKEGQIGITNLNINELIPSELNFDEYESYAFSQKVGFALGLYCDKRVKLADKYMSQLEKSARSRAEKELVKTAKQNKKLLIKKGK